MASKVTRSFCRCNVSKIRTHVRAHTRTRTLTHTHNKVRNTHKPQHKNIVYFIFGRPISLNFVFVFLVYSLAHAHALTIKSTSEQYAAYSSQVKFCYIFFFFARGRKDEVMVGSHFCVKQDLKWLMAPETLLRFFLFLCPMFLLLMRLHRPDL